jgi:streptomycin 6-kinase
MRIPDAVRRTAMSRGPATEAWLAALPATVAELAAEWSLTLGDALDGGTHSLVVSVNDGDAVLKLVPPGDTFAGEWATLAAAAGDGYVRVFRHDATRNAALLEALGPPINTASPEHVLDASAATLQAAWRIPRSGPPGQHKAAGLIDLIESLWVELGRPCPLSLKDKAIGYARERLAAAATAEAVWCHGDPHAANLLSVRRPRPGADSGYVFVDPEGIACEPAYDLGVVVRGFHGELRAAADPHGLLRRYCARLAAATGVDAEAIWEWGFVERVSSGLYLMRHGHPAEGRRFLASALALTDR